MTAQSFDKTSFAIAQDKQDEEKLLPKEPLELPKPQTDASEELYQQSMVRTLLAWHAPGRPYKKRRKEYYLTSLLIMVLVEIILFLFSQYLLMLVVISLVFVAFALAIVAPHNFHYRISTQGVTIEDHSFLWEELYDFYFKRRDGIDILHIRTRAFLPGELTITLGDMNKDHIREILLPYLPYREVVKKTFMENSADWLSHNFPLEKS